MVAVQRNASYGPDPRHRLDVYCPEGQSVGPSVIFLHGGSWNSGSKDAYRMLGKSLAKQGFLTVIPNYRLYPTVRFPTFNEDAALVCTWLNERGNSLGATTDQIAVMGHSAGAHMGALLCLDPAYLGVQNIAKISHFVGLAGPYSANLTRIDTTAPIFSHAADIDRTRPVKLVANAPEFPRFLLLHGKRDRTVGEQNTVNLAAALAENGARVQANSYAKLGHLGIFLTMNPGLRWISPVWRDVMRFLKDPG